MRWQAAAHSRMRGAPRAGWVPVPALGGVVPVRRQEAERQGHAGDEQRADVHLPPGPGVRLETWLWLYQRTSQVKKHVETPRATETARCHTVVGNNNLAMLCHSECACCLPAGTRLGRQHLSQEHELSQYHNFCLATST